MDGRSDFRSVAIVVASNGSDPSIWLAADNWTLAELAESPRWPTPEQAGRQARLLRLSLV